jgi:hypothetical protein
MNIHNSIDTHSIVRAYSSIENIHSIESEREKVQSSTEFQEWCKRYSIGSRVHSIDTKATELMRQYGERYTNWVKSNSKI